MFTKASNIDSIKLYIVLGAKIAYEMGTLPSPIYFFTAFVKKLADLIPSE